MTDEDQGQRRVMVALISMGLTFLACLAAATAVAIVVTIAAI
ncbi:hypothetical protein [Streptomyces corynorhini]|nr:hypothetical protein [Streptomyces corynorhini]